MTQHSKAETGKTEFPKEVEPGMTYEEAFAIFGEIMDQMDRDVYAHMYPVTGGFSEAMRTITSWRNNGEAERAIKNTHLLAMAYRALAAAVTNMGHPREQGEENEYIGKPLS